jgi:flagellar motor switch protein FliG
MATMETTNQNGAGSAAEFSSLSNVQKLAALLLVLDAENAAKLLAQFEEQDLEAISAEMVKFTMISQEMQQDLLQEFSTVAVEAAASVQGGVGRAKGLLEKSVGTYRAAEIIGKVSPQLPSVGGMQQLAEMDTRQVFSVLRYEQLQTIALVISYMPPEKASQMLSMVRPDLRDKVVERLATLTPTSLEVVEGVADELHRKLSGNRTQALNHTGGIKVAAQVMNALPKDTADTILAALKDRNAELGEEVLKKMLTFEELKGLNSKTLQKIMQEVDMRTVAVALKTASDAMKAALLSSISKRAAENVREEISFLGQLKPREIEDAQNEIIATVRRLEGDGEIDLDEIRQKPRF